MLSQSIGRDIQKFRNDHVSRDITQSLSRRLEQAQTTYFQGITQPGVKQATRQAHDRTYFRELGAIRVEIDTRLGMSGNVPTASVAERASTASTAQSDESLELQTFDSARSHLSQSTVV